MFKKIDPETYVRAFKRLYTKKDDYCCVAIDRVVPYAVPAQKHIEAFRYGFLDEGSELFHTPAMWFGRIGGPGTRLARELALLFMAEFVRDEQKRSTRKGKRRA